MLPTLLELLRGIHSFSVAHSAAKKVFDVRDAIELIRGAFVKQLDD